MNGLRAWLRKRGAGRLLYRWYHRPRRQFDLARAYGYQLVWAAARGERAMRRAAHCLEPPAIDGDPLPVPICFLTSRDFAHQTLFCAHSLVHAAGTKARFEFLSDGRLDAGTAAELRRVFPCSLVSAEAELDEIVSIALPPGKFPTLHAMRNSFVLLRKLTDSMAGRSGFRVLLDSDMLFWRPPDELRARLSAREPLYLRDISAEGYTAPRAELERRFGIQVAVGVNSGLVGLDASRLDWELLERICAFLRDSPGDRRLLEQTLWAVALGAVNARPLDPSDYVVAITPADWTAVQHAKLPPVLLHYAWHARLPYFAKEWQRYLANPCPNE